MVFVLLCLGLTSSTLFHVFLKENSYQPQTTSYDLDVENNMECKDWFKEGQFYIVSSCQYLKISKYKTEMEYNMKN